MDLNLKGRRILITGASQGIGEGLARGFAAEGSELFLVARSAERLQNLAAELEARHATRVHTLPVDLTAKDSVGAVVGFAGDVDVLVNNAGDVPGGNLLEIDEPKWRLGWELKVFGYINLTRAMYVAMKGRGFGIILNNIGAGGENYDFDYIAGTTANAALMAFTRALGGRSLDDGIRVVGVNAGPVDTPRIDRMLRAQAQRLLGDPNRYGELVGKLPRGRLATVAEVADLFLFLASDKAAHLTGTILTVDGGLISRR